MEKLFIGIAGFLILGIIYAWHRHFYDYRIRRDCLEVTWMGICVRRVSIQNIESVSKRRKFAAENWANTWRPRHRILVIRKRTGMRRDFVITPRYRYEFRNQLESIMNLGQPNSSKDT